MTLIITGMLLRKNLGYSWKISMTTSGHSVNTRKDEVELGDICGVGVPVILEIEGFSLVVVPESGVATNDADAAAVTLDSAVGPGDMGAGEAASLTFVGELSSSPSALDCFSESSLEAVGVTCCLV